MIALYSVLSPCVFAFRCKRLQYEVKKYYRCRLRALLSKFGQVGTGKNSKDSMFNSDKTFNGFGGALDRSDIERLQLKHKQMLAHHSTGTLFRILLVG